MTNSTGFMHCCTSLYTLLMTAVCDPNIKALLCFTLGPDSVSVIHFPVNSQVGNISLWFSVTRPVWWQMCLNFVFKNVSLTNLNYWQTARGTYQSFLNLVKHQYILMLNIWNAFNTHFSQYQYISFGCVFRSPLRQSVDRLLYCCTAHIAQPPLEMNYIALLIKY